MICFWSPGGYHSQPSHSLWLASLFLSRFVKRIGESSVGDYKLTLLRLS